MNITREVNMTFTHNLVIHLPLKKSVLHMGVKLYKCLPLRIKKMDSLKQFRREVKLILLKETFYTLGEFLQAKLM